MDFSNDLIEPETTGNRLVFFHPAATEQDMRAAVSAAGAYSVATASDVAAMAGDDGGADAVLIETFNVAVVRSVGDGATAAALDAQPAVARSRPEFFLYPIDWHQRRLAWLEEAGSILLSLRREGTGYVGGETVTQTAGAAETWGVRRVDAVASGLTGKGIRVGVLDTGIALDHPDFVGRVAKHQDFTGGGSAVDRQGHGTHVAGTIAGPAKPASGAPRYGVAPDVDLHVYKVLNDQGRGAEGQIIAAMAQAVTDRCVVINMSLGRPAARGNVPSQDYENIGLRALQLGTLIVAAAGNESARDIGHIAPVGYPANSPSIMAVAALDDRDVVATFSCGEINPGGGEVNIAGPGVEVFSSTIRARGSYATLSGTSMAAPHVTGVAALLAESNPQLRGRPLWTALETRARKLGLMSRRDVGVGATRF